MLRYKKEQCFKLPLWLSDTFDSYSDEAVGQAVDAVIRYFFYSEMPDLFGDSFDLFIILKRIADYQKKYPRWRGGSMENNSSIRNSIAYREWRDAVFLRDNYTCQICGKRGGKINAHHIRHFAKYPELRLALENGITLCEECHREEHRRCRTES